MLAPLRLEVATMYVHSLRSTMYTEAKERGKKPDLVEFERFSELAKKAKTEGRFPTEAQLAEVVGKLPLEEGSAQVRRELLEFTERETPA